jgi:hypothetical protein
MTTTDHNHRPRGQKGAGMTEEESSWQTEDEQPEVEGHREAAAPERVTLRSEDAQEQEEPEVGGHAIFTGPEKALGPEKAKGPERISY